jgi:tRNA pseudouridine-54 N-methylase
MSTREVISAWTSTSSISDIDTSDFRDRTREDETSLSDVSSSSISVEPTKYRPETPQISIAHKIHNREALERQIHLLELSKEELRVSSEAKYRAYELQIKSLESCIVDLRNQSAVPFILFRKKMIYWLAKRGKSLHSKIPKRKLCK